MDTTETNPTPSEDDCFEVNEKSLSEFNFPVEFRDVYVDLRSGDKGLLFPGSMVKQEKHLAVVDVDREHTFAIVSPDYEIVSNLKAVQLAEKCFQTVFKLTDTSEMKLFNVIMPKTRSQCHIDFLHRQSRFHIQDGDPWAPFIRVSNSFNRSRALKFDLGFCRGICRNGLIFGKESIEFKFSHTRGVSVLALAEFKLKGGEFSRLEAQFRGRLENLQRYHVSSKLMWPLLCKVFALSPPSKEASARTKANWEEQKSVVAKLTKKYFEELEPTGYAALNVLTDYATRPPAVSFGVGRIHGLQTTSGLWVEDFVRAISSKEFDFKKYLGEYYALAT